MDRLAPRTSLRDGSTPRIRDLSLLYSSLYDFWLFRGAWGATVNQFVGVCNIFALWTFAFATFFMLDWDLVFGCEGEGCAKRSLFHPPLLSGNMSAGHTFFAVCFLLACGASVLWEIRSFIEVAFVMNELHDDLRQHFRLGDRTPMHSWYFAARRFIHGRQGHALLPDEEDSGDAASGGAHVEAVDRHVFQSIADIKWNDFLHTVIRRVLRKDSGISNRHEVDELRVVQTMCVVENYLVALHSHHFFRRGSVLWWASETVVKELLRLQFHQGRLLAPAEAVARTKASLRWGFVASVALYPLVVSFFLAKLLIRHVAVARSNPRYLVEYEWTQEAFWTFRLYNELPHLYEARMRTALENFQRVMEDTEPPIIILRFPHRVAEIAILLIVALGLINANALTAGHFGSRAVVWWLGVALLIFGMTAATQRHRETSHRTDAYLAGISRLYYEDARWRQQTSAFRSNVTRHFLWPRIAVLLRDFSTVLFLPGMLLWLYLKGDEEFGAMAAFLHEQSIHVNGVGHVCALASFDTDAEQQMRLRTVSSDTEGDGEGAAAAFALTSSTDAEEMHPVDEHVHVVHMGMGIPAGKSPEDQTDRAVGETHQRHLDNHAGFIGAIDADFVPRAVTLRKREVSLVHFSAVHTHWAEHAAIHARTADVRRVAGFVNDGQESLASINRMDDRTVLEADPRARRLNSAPNLERQTVPLDPHDIAHWHTARFFRDDHSRDESA